MKKVSIINYGLSNLLSVEHAFRCFGVQEEIINTCEDIEKAEVLVLPGVGAFEDGMKGLEALNLIRPLRQKVTNGTPLLGICLGMQLLFDESEEFGLHRGLGFIPGRVVEISGKDINGMIQKVPHISWDPLLASGNKSFSGTILEDVAEGEECYFIHSFEAVPSKQENRLADTIYGGRRICAVAYDGNVYGTQFHPEKSGQVGLRIIKKFIDMFC